MIETTKSFPKSASRDCENINKNSNHNDTDNNRSIGCTWTVTPRSLFRRRAQKLRDLDYATCLPHPDDGEDDENASLDGISPLPLTSPIIGGEAPAPDVSSPHGDTSVPCHTGDLESTGASPDLCSLIHPDASGINNSRCSSPEHHTEVALHPDAPDEVRPVRGPGAVECIEREDPGHEAKHVARAHPSGLSDTGSSPSPPCAEEGGEVTSPSIILRGPPAGLMTTTSRCRSASSFEATREGSANHLFINNSKYNHSRHSNQTANSFNHFSFSESRNINMTTMSSNATQNPRAFHEHRSSSINTTHNRIHDNNISLYCSQDTGYVSDSAAPLCRFLQYDDDGLNDDNASGLVETPRSAAPDKAFFRPVPTAPLSGPSHCGRGSHEHRFHCRRYTRVPTPSNGNAVSSARGVQEGDVPWDKENANHGQTGAINMPFRPRPPSSAR